MGPAAAASFGVAGGTRGFSKPADGSVIGLLAQTVPGGWRGMEREGQPQARADLFVLGFSFVFWREISMSLVRVQYSAAIHYSQHYSAFKA